MTDHTQSFSIRKWSRLSFRFGCFRFFLCKLCGFRFAMGIIRVAHFFKLRLGHDKLVKLLSRRGKDRAVANIINACLRNIAQIFRNAVLQNRNREHFALAAEQRRIVANTVNEIHLRSYGIIVALIGEKAAGRYIDMALMGKIIAGRMLAVALAVKSVLHYGLHGGNLTVNKVFHATRQRVVVKREAPDDNVRGNELFYAACHIFGANVMVSAELRQNAANVMKAIKELREDPEMARRFKVLVTTAGDPMPWSNFVKEQGMIWMHVFPGVRTAARCKKAGVQVLIASGHEGGMHTAWQPVHSLTLLPDIVEKFSDENTLVCGAGGFCDGKSMAAAFAMGADGVQMGTRFLATEESDFCDLWKKMVIDCQDGGTLVARGFVGPARWLRTDVSLQHAYNTAKDAPGSYVGVPDDFSTIPMDLLTFERVGVAATYAGDVEHAMAGAGECAQRITDLPKTADMVKKCVDDAEEILKGISGKYLA